jgi:uncharacterized protein YkwD
MSAGHRTRPPLLRRPVLSRFHLVPIVFSVLVAAVIAPPLPTLSDVRELQSRSASAQAQEIGDDEAVAEVGGAVAAAPEAIEIELFNLANRDRLAHGLPPLQLDHQLLEIARVRAAAQANQPSLSHTDPSGQLAFVRLIADVDVGYRLVGENLARVGSPTQTAAERAEDALMNSPAHRANILEPAFDSLVVGTAVDPRGQIVFAQIFRAGA